MSSNSSASGSDEAHLAKHDADDTMEDTGYSSQSSSQTLAPLAKHSGKVHPSNIGSHNVSECESENITKLTAKDSNEPANTPVSDALPHQEPEMTSTSKASDVEVVGINSVDLSDVESVHSNNEMTSSLPKLDTCGSLEHGVTSDASRVLYHLYTISVST